LTQKNSGNTLTAKFVVQEVSCGFLLLFSSGIG
jgi:hypothetical protein